ncbi:hypothetical protein CAPTEDRAFT_195782 [Capitella teleta]|uniref:G-protein coupled receptors family 1 profile domain-containing protein n=1 Tax=Capitella teleta TaxID=283909 RepID=R7TQ14_CAPTE|nr:hypothetical protein CAPTEDRAFT_195782 [Capitella teleta]|eukprot:ELT93130.1 hypothetical protein CAPTEDRAFT_195782 [Capitella teleta]
MFPNETSLLQRLCLILDAVDYFVEPVNFTESSFLPSTTSATSESLNVTSSFTFDAFASPPSVSVIENIKYAFSGVINPIFCVCGIIGNFFNVLVLTRPRMQVAMDCSLEKSAQTGLISLAISDMLYCITSIIRAFITQSQVVFPKRDIWLFIQLYGSYIQNIFANTSTWLTVIMATGRYAAICKPLHARHLVGVAPTRIAVILTFGFWVLLQLPSAWTYKTIEVNCNTQSFIVMDNGPFNSNNKLKLTFGYLWASVGFVIPVIILAYCNVHLIRALRESRRMRKLYVYRATSKVKSGNRVTPTLIAIVFMFLVLVSPSEILQFFHYHVSASSVETFNILLVIANTLQTINFSMNFVLYCILNVQFRETLKGVIFCLFKRNAHNHRWRQRRSRAMSNSTKGSIVIHSNFESFISGSSSYRKENSKSNHSGTELV